MWEESDRKQMKLNIINRFGFFSNYLIPGRYLLKCPILDYKNITPNEFIRKTGGLPIYIQDHILLNLEEVINCIYRKTNEIENNKQT